MSTTSVMAGQGLSSGRLSVISKVVGTHGAGCHWRLVPILSGKFSWLRPRIGALPFGVREPRSRFCHAQPCCAWYRSAAMLQTNKAPAWLAHSTIAPPAHSGANLFRTVLDLFASADFPRTLNTGR